LCGRPQPEHESVMPPVASPGWGANERGSGGRMSPSGVQGQSPGGGLGAKCPEGEAYANLKGTKPSYICTFYAFWYAFVFTYTHTHTP